MEMVTEKRNRYFMEMGLFVLGVTSVFPTLFGHFIFDDGEAILNNEDVTGRSSRTGAENSLTQIFWHDFWGSRIDHNNSHKSYRPLTTLTYRLDFCLWGKNPFPFHFINWILHGINCILVFHFLRSCLAYAGNTGASTGSTLSKVEENVISWASVLFSVHPIHVEPLGGIVGRADLLSSLVFLTGFILVSALEPSQLTPYIMISVIGIFGSLFKENCVVLVVFYLAWIGFCRKCHASNSRQFKNYFLAILVTSIFIAWRLWFQNGPPIFQNFDNPPAFAESWFSKVFSIAYIWILNVWILVNPSWLCFDWSMGCISLVQSKSDPRFFLVSGFTIAAIHITINVFKSSWNRILRLGLLIGVVTFLPSSNLICAVGFVIAERNLYLPSVGFCLVISYAVLKFSNGKALLTFIAVMFYARSIHRSIDWVNAERLFQSAQNVCPNNAKVHYNIGAVHAETGNFESAMTSYRHAIELKPDYYQAMNNLGNILRSRDELKESEFWLRKALLIKDDFAAAWMNLGIVMSKKNASEAMECYKTALTHRHFYPDCHYNIGNLYLETKDYSKALQSWIQVTIMQPSHVQSWLNIVILLEQQRRFHEAKQYGEKALKAIGSEDDTLLFLLGNIHGQLEEYQLAEEFFIKAIKRSAGKSTPAKYWSNLGVLYHRWGKLGDARKCYEKALEIQPNLESARSNLLRLKNLETRRS